MGELVAAKSHLADEFKQVCLQKAANLNREITVPRDFDKMRGYNGKISKASMTNEFSLEFNASGDSASQLDFAAENLYTFSNSEMK